MSKRRRRQSKGIPWVFIALGAVFIIAAIVRIANQNGSGSVSDIGTPQIAVDQQKIDYGYVKFGNDKQFSVKVTNSGDGVLRFNVKPYIEVLEGC